LAGYELKYVTRKSIKGRAIAEHCAEHPVMGQTLDDDFPDEDVLMIEEGRMWKMYFDGASNQYGDGVGVLLIAPDGSHIPMFVKLNFENSSNTAEYEACIAGMEVLLVLGVRQVEVYGDSALVISQVQKIWRTREEHLKPYQGYLEKLARKFDKVTYIPLPRSHNQFADALATLASMINVPEGAPIKPLSINQRSRPAYEEAVMLIDAELNDGKPWYYDIKNVIEKGEYPEGANWKDRRALRLMAAQYILCGGDLYRRSYDGVHLMCVDEEKARVLMGEVHEGVCRPHMSGKMLAKKIVRMGYFWTTMIGDCIEYVKKCH